MAAVGISASEASDVGGIDLNSTNMDLRIKRDGSTGLTTSGQGVPLPLGQQDMVQLGRMEGFVPIIISITPVTSLPFLSAQ